MLGIVFFEGVLILDVDWCNWNLKLKYEFGLNLNFKYMNKGRWINVFV